LASPQIHHLGSRHFLQPTVAKPPTTLVKQAIVNQESPGSAQLAGEINDFLHRAPGAVGGDSDQINASWYDRQGITGMEEPPFTSGFDHQTNITDPGNIAMNDSMLTADGADDNFP
jgi:hypothetical protein